MVVSRRKLFQSRLNSVSTSSIRNRLLREIVIASSTATQADVVYSGSSGVVLLAPAHGSSLDITASFLDFSTFHIFTAGQRGRENVTSGNSISPDIWLQRVGSGLPCVLSITVRGRK